MTKDEADAIIELAKRLLQEDCAVETRQRVARQILTHARAIKASCMAEPAIKYGGVRQTIIVNGPSGPVPVPPGTVYSYEFGTNIPLIPLTTQEEAREQAKTQLARQIVDAGIRAMRRQS